LREVVSTEPSRSRTPLGIILSIFVFVFVFNP
jgi:hypothetical protein